MRRRAFSLVEVVIVLAIVAVAAAVATPRYANAVTHYRAEAAARRIVAELETLRAAARAESQSRSIAFAKATGVAKYTVGGQNDPDRPGSAYVVDLTAPPYRCRLRSIDLGGDNELVFNGYGVPDSGGEVIVQCGRVTRRITIDAAKGGATIAAPGDAAAIN